MPRAGLPTYIPDRTRDEHDVALKPLHDPYLGDEPTSTAKCTPAQNSMRETVPSFDPMSSGLSLNRPLPRMNDELHQQPVASSYPAPAVTRTQAVADGENQAAKVHWPESQPAPNSQPRIVAPALVAPAPTTPAAQTDAHSPYSSRNHYSYAPQAADPWHNGSAEDQHPGYFRRLWNALKGE
jgi:hypothetical protein